MKKIIVAMFDREGYTKRLAEYLIHHCNAMLDVRLFTNVENMLKFLRREAVEMLLVGEKDWDSAWENEVNVHRLIFLSDGDMVCEGTSRQIIFKYQSAESIVKELLSVIAEDDSIQTVNVKLGYRNAEFIGVYSPFGGAGASTFAYRMAKEYGVQYLTLYLNMELFNGMSIYQDRQHRDITGTDRGGMSELIFYLQQNRDKLAVKIQALVQRREGIDCIAAVEDYRDLYSMKVADLRHLLQVLAEETEYQKILFDIGYLGESSLELMRHCDILYLPKAGSDIQQNKQSSFEQLLIREGDQDMLERIQFVTMKEAG